MPDFYTRRFFSPEHVGTLRFVVHTTPQDEEQVFAALVRRLQREDYREDYTAERPGEPDGLAPRIFFLTRQTLGRGFVATEIGIRRGSIIITVGLGAFAVYEGMSRYENFVKSVTLLQSQIKGLLSKISHDSEEPLSILRVDSSWEPADLPKENASRQPDPNA